MRTPSTHWSYMESNYNNIISILHTCSKADLWTPSWIICDNAHQVPGNNTSAREGNHPTEIDPHSHAPVGSSLGTKAVTDAKGRTRNTLGS